MAYKKVNYAVSVFECILRSFLFMFKIGPSWSGMMAMPASVDPMANMSLTVICGAFPHQPGYSRAAPRGASIVAKSKKHKVCGETNVGSNLYSVAS